MGNIRLGKIRRRRRGGQAGDRRWGDPGGDAGGDSGRDAGRDAGKARGGEKPQGNSFNRVMNIFRGVCVDEGRGMQVRVRTLACTLDIAERGCVHYVGYMNLSIMI